MSSCAAIVREAAAVTTAVAEAWRLCDRVQRELACASPQSLPDASRAMDMCLTHAVYLEALREYLKHGGQSRGSYLVLDPRGEPLDAKLDEEWRYRSVQPDDPVSQKILEVCLDADRQVCKRWVDIRPVPNVDGWFETVWNEYRQDRVVR